MKRLLAIISIFLSIVAQAQVDTTGTEINAYPSMYLEGKDSLYMYDAIIDSSGNVRGYKLTATKKVIPATIFGAKVPKTPLVNDGIPTELGMKFSSTKAGSVLGIRYYKATGNLGKRIVELYDIKGNRLEQYVYVNETAKGWQEIRFCNPVPILANTIYVAAVHSTQGYYTGTEKMLPANNGTLTAVQSVYIYSNVPAFPTQTYNNLNYWVDVLFK